MNRSAPFDLDGWLRQWRTWLEPVTDRLFDLDERTRTGSADEQADLAAAFVARKAIADRLDAVAGGMGRDRDAAQTLANSAIVDGSGGAVGDDLDDAARLLEAIILKLDRQVAAREVGDRQRADLIADLDAADRLAADLGERTNQVVELRRAIASGRDPDATARAVRDMRAELERLAAERTRLLARWRDLAGQLATLAAAEAEVRALAARCREKVADAPTIAVPSVAVVQAAERAATPDSQTWPRARATIAPIVAQVDRLAAALTEARRRFQEPLTRRDDLRGLLQSFRSKAAAKGFGEHADVERRFRAAESVLWSAPCDLTAAQPLVDDFVVLVNTLTAEGAR